MMRETSGRAIERDGMSWPPGAWEALADDGWPPAAETAERPRGAAWSALRDVVQTLLLTAVLFAGVRLAVQNYMVESVSMQPTLVEGQFIWVDKVLYRLQHGPERGDIVVFQSWGQDKPFVKRVVGRPGQTIEIRDGHVLVNGAQIDEPYLSQPTDGAVGPITLGPDEYYVLGDNRGNSSDSRVYGPLPGTDIVGRAWLRYWPPNQVGLLNEGAGPSFASGPER
jgi:signal peptidase I